MQVQLCALVGYEQSALGHYHDVDPTAVGQFSPHRLGAERVARRGSMLRSVLPVSFDSL